MEKCDECNGLCVSERFVILKKGDEQKRLCRDGYYDCFVELCNGKDGLHKKKEWKIIQYAEAKPSTFTPAPPFIYNCYICNEKNELKIDDWWDDDSDIHICKTCVIKNIIKKL
jgi:hypothetical protein